MYDDIALSGNNKQNISQKVNVKKISNKRYFYEFEEDNYIDLSLVRKLSIEKNEWNGGSIDYTVSVYFYGGYRAEHKTCEDRSFYDQLKKELLKLQKLINKEQK